jgi:hypothetical protein
MDARLPPPPLSMPQLRFTPHASHFALDFALDFAHYQISPGIISTELSLSAESGGGHFFPEHAKHSRRSLPSEPSPPKPDSSCSSVRAR